MQFNLRSWNIHDASNLSYFANNKRISDNLRDSFPNPYTLEDAFWYINYTMSQDEKKQFFRAIEVDNKAIGSIGLVFKSNELYHYAELGYWLAEEYWNKGITTRAVKMMCTIAFENFELDYIKAEVFTDNIGSIRVLEKASFTNVDMVPNAITKNGVSRDIFIYQRNNLQ